MKYHNLLLCVAFLCFFSTTFTSSLLCALEINISNGNVKIGTESGEQIDTSEIDRNKNSDEDSGNVSIGEIKNSGKSSSNIVKNAELENITVIQNGKVKIYSSNKDNMEKQDE